MVLTGVKLEFAIFLNKNVMVKPAWTLLAVFIKITFKSRFSLGLQLSEN